GKVQRPPVEGDGGSFRVRNEDFLISEDPDFYPTDVLQDADGSLLVVNTGGWFRIGCPTSQVAKPEIKGALYRVRRAGALAPQDPYGRKIDRDRPPAPEPRPPRPDPPVRPPRPPRPPPAPAGPRGPPRP